MGKDKGTLFLIPSLMGDSTTTVLPQYFNDLTDGLTVFVVENLRSARRFLRKAGFKGDFDQMEMYELDKYKPEKNINQFVQPLLQGKDVGLLSEAGCPGVADPGSLLVAACHKKGITVKPMVGPSSLLMALMASGMNGQQFMFHGYLPFEKSEKLKKLRSMEGSAVRGTANLFIETPYRNDKLLLFMIVNLKPQTKLCIATDITLETEMIATKTLGEWQKNLPKLHKRPTVFILG